jgi:hypothetical protein
MDAPIRPYGAEWTLEYGLVDGLLRRIEDAERARLKKIRCPANPVQIHRILKEEDPAPWPPREDDRARRVAYRAMYVLALANQVRRHLSPDEENARLAAHDAVLVGLAAGREARRALEPAKGGLARGQQITEATRKRDELFDRLLQEWANSEDAQREHSAVAFVKERSGISVSPKTLNRSRSRQRHRKKGQ